MQCEVLADRLPGHIDDPSVLEAPEVHHVEHCLRCQAHTAQYRRLRRDLLSLRADYLIPSPAELAALLDTLRPPAPVVRLRRRSKRLAYLGGIAASAAAGAIVVGISLATRPRMSSADRSLVLPASL